MRLCDVRSAWARFIAVPAARDYGLFVTVRAHSASPRHGNAAQRASRLHEPVGRAGPPGPDSRLTCQVGRHVAKALRGAGRLDVEVTPAPSSAPASLLAVFDLHNSQSVPYSGKPLPPLRLFSVEAAIWVEATKEPRLEGNKHMESALTSKAKKGAAVNQILVRPCEAD